MIQAAGETNPRHAPWQLVVYVGNRSGVFVSVGKRLVWLKHEARALGGLPESALGPPSPYDVGAGVIQKKEASQAKWAFWYNMFETGHTRQTT